MTGLVLGPALRYVDDTSATVWVETDGPCTVEVLGCSAETFRVGGHHYALVPVHGLRPGSSTPYEVHLDGTRVWPEDTGRYPRSRIRTIPRGPDAKLRLLFGSCRFGKTEDREHSTTLGPDALDAYTRRMVEQPEDRWPDTLLLLGDQIYADQTTPQVRRQLRQRRDLDHPPGTEVADFEEYTYLYLHAWSDPDMRWLLSTLPTMMIFDDHDVRDDWNTSRAWRERMSREPWWRERLLGGLVSYWVYQHIGNLSPAELERDEVYHKVLEAGRSGDALSVLREFAERADADATDPLAARWSYQRDLGPARAVVVDTRGGRVLSTGERAMLPEADFRWLEDSLTGDHEHLVVATSLPWLMPHAVHHLQSWNEAVASGRGRWADLGERIRQGADLEHWAAFRASFDRLSDIVRRVAQGRPSSVSVLSGDVHHSYLADAEYPGGTRSRVVQVTCSPVHNALPRAFTGPLRLTWSKWAARPFRWLAERVGVRPPPLRWSKSAGPYFGNAVAELELDGSGSAVHLHQVTNDSPELTTACYRRLTS